MKYQVSEDVFDYKKKVKLREGEWVTIVNNHHGDVIIVERENFEVQSVNKNNLKGLC